MTLPAWEAILQGVMFPLVQGSWSSLSLCFISKDAWPWHCQMTKIRTKCSSWWFIMIVWNLKSPEVPCTTLFTLYITFYWRVVCTWFNLLHRPMQYKYPLVNQYFDFPESKIICMILGSSDSQDKIHSVQRTQGVGLGNVQSFYVCLHFLSHAVKHLLPFSEVYVSIPCQFSAIIRSCVISVHCKLTTIL